MELVHAVGVVVADVAAQLNRIRRARNVLKLPIVSRSTFLDMSSVLKPLQMFVRLAVELKVCLECCLVSAEATQVVTADEKESFVLPLAGSICANVTGKYFRSIVPEYGADETLKYLGRISF